MQVGSPQPFQAPLYRSRTAASRRRVLGDSADRLELSSAPPKMEHSTKGLQRALLTVALLTSTAAAAAAQVPPPVLETSQSCCDSTATKGEFSLKLSVNNDNMPTFLSGLVDREDRIPNSPYADDDGWTAAILLEGVHTRGDEQWVVGVGLNMLTETGSWDGTGQDRRTDLGNLVVQRNFRRQDHNSTFDWGLGGGLQAVGNLSGRSVQEWWHRSTPMGGRTGNALQANYTSEGARVIPLVTGAVRYNHQLGSGFEGTLGAQAMLPVGQGLAVGTLTSSVVKSLGPVRLELGGSLEAANSQAPETAFHDLNQVAPGAFLKVGTRVGKVGRVDLGLSKGGFRDEAQMTIALTFGGGSPARLSPLDPLH